MSHTLLIVDDEENVLHAIRRTLRKEPYKVVTYSSSTAALTYLEENPVQLIISDCQMPEMSGIEFLQTASQIQPNAVRVVLSGYAEIHVVVDAINKGAIYRFLAKPWDDEDLKINIKTCVAKYELQSENKKLADELKSQNAALEKLLAERSQYLTFTQEIIDALPMPILGVGSDNCIALCNQAYLQKSSDGYPGIYLGQPIDEAFPALISQAISDKKANVRLDINSVPVAVNLCGMSDMERGTILTFEDLNNE